jgi:hypothetical protein
MVSVLSETFADFDFKILVSELRHALDAFAHKIGRPASWDPVLIITANHTGKTSAGYGRDQHCIPGIPADLSEQNAERSDNIKHETILWYGAF